MSSTLSQELAKLTIMKPAELRARWREVYRATAPDIGPDLLRRGIAYRLQERGQGSLTSSTKRTIEKMIKQLGKGEGIASNNAPVLKAGTRLVRSWRGRCTRCWCWRMAMSSRDDAISRLRK
jgi:hypothetical protein